MGYFRLGIRFKIVLGCTHIMQLLFSMFSLSLIFKFEWGRSDFL